MIWDCYLVIATKLLTMVEELRQSGCLKLFTSGSYLTLSTRRLRVTVEILDLRGCQNLGGLGECPKIDDPKIKSENK
jgi:hypothetical protein